MSTAPEQHAFLVGLGSHARHEQWSPFALNLLADVTARLTVLEAVAAGARDARDSSLAIPGRLLIALGDLDRLEGR